MGSLMRLIAFGAQDVYLTRNPQITFFKVVSKTNFISKNKLQLILSDDKNIISDNCSICLNEYVTGEKLGMTQCRHYYHWNCIITYIRSSNDPKCPLCRAIISI